MKKLLSFILASFLAVAVYTGCKKDVAPIQSDQQLISEARNYFNAHVSKSEQQVQAGNNPLQHLKKTALWDNVVVYAYGTGKAVEIPIRFDDGGFGHVKNGGALRPLSELAKLIIFKDENNEFNYDVIISFPDASYGLQSEKFKGVVLTTDWNLNVRQSHRFTDEGILRIVDRDEFLTHTGSNDENVANLIINVCTSISWDIYVNGIYSYTYVQNTGCYYINDGSGPPVKSQDPGSGGGGGGLGNPSPGDNADSPLGTDCESFTFTQTAGNWQEAGLNQIRLRWVWTGDYVSRTVWINHVVYGLPKEYSDGTQVTEGQAKVKAAKATELAKYYTYVEFRNSPVVPADAVVINFFKTKLNQLMIGVGGTASTNGSNSPAIVFRNEQRSGTFGDPYDCD